MRAARNGRPERPAVLEEATARFFPCDWMALTLTARTDGYLAGVADGFSGVVQRANL